MNYVDESLNVYFDTRSGGSAGASLTKAQKKNAQKRQKRKEKRQKETGFEIEEVIEGLGSTSLSDNPPKKPVNDTPPPLADDTPPPLADDTPTLPVAADQVKRNKTLQKKLHQIEELERKIASGEIPKPDKDQLKKISNKESLRKELVSLQQT